MEQAYIALYLLRSNIRVKIILNEKMFFAKLNFNIKFASVLTKKNYKKMKKVILFVAVISAFSFASCKKDRTCTCVTSPGGGTTVETFTASTKGNASAACLSYSQTSNGTTTTTTCTLK